MSSSTSKFTNEELTFAPYLMKYSRALSCNVNEKKTCHRLVFLEMRGLLA
jgi:hypothetical protein